MSECEMPAGTVRGEKGALAFSTSGSRVLDLFFELVPHVEPAEVDRLLDAAWRENAADTLKLIFQTGNARANDGGKMDRENFYLCLMWLWRRHPDTLLLNLRAIPAHACLKDLLELLTGVFELSAGLGGTDAAISEEFNEVPLNAAMFATGVWELNRPGKVSTGQLFFLIQRGEEGVECQGNGAATACKWPCSAALARVTGRSLPPGHAPQLTPWAHATNPMHLACPPR